MRAFEPVVIKFLPHRLRHFQNMVFERVSGYFWCARIKRDHIVLGANQDHTVYDPLVEIEFQIVSVAGCVRTCIILMKNNPTALFFLFHRISDKQMVAYQ